MAEPVLKGPLGYKMVMRFNMGIWGWNESVYLWYTGPNAPGQWLIAKADAVAIATSRRGALSPNCTLWGYRLQQYGSGARGSLFLKDGGDGCGPGEADVAGEEPVWDALQVSLYDDSFTYRRPYDLRGLPSEWVKFDPSGSGGLTPAGEDEVLRYLHLLTNSIPADAGGLAGTSSLYGRDKDPATPGTTGRQEVISAELNPTCGTDIVTAAVPLWLRGERVHIHQKAACDAICPVPGLSGDACVIKITPPTAPATTPYTTTISRRPCCCTADLEIPPGTTINLVRKGYYELDEFTDGGVVKRDTGGAGGATRGRARSCARG